MPLRKRINDLPNIDAINDFDSFEVSQFNDGDRVSSHVNAIDLATYINDLNSANVIYPTRFGAGSWSNDPLAASYRLNPVNSSSRAYYQEIIINLQDWGTVPADATHVNLHAYNWFIATNVNGWWIQLLGLDWSESTATWVTNHESMLTQLTSNPQRSALSTQQAIAQIQSKQILQTKVTNINGAGQLMHVTSESSSFIPINRTSGLTRVKVLVLATQGLSYNFVGGYQLPASLADIYYWTIDFSVKGFLAQ